MEARQASTDLTLEEKVSLLSGKDFWQTRAIPRADIPGMFLADGPHGVRRQAVAADHLGLNASLPATCFPTAATVANSWDPRLGELLGSSLGKEALHQGVSVLLGPGLNIKRNPRCGRNFEYFSEDPLLSGRMAAAYIRGIQSNGIAACAKHFAVNNQETARMSIDAVVDDRTLRELYLTAFEIAVKEGAVKTVMSSYNRINGTYANDSSYLLDTILRKEWGFDGVIVTDWGGSNERVSGLLAGNDLEMPGTAGQSDREVLEAVKEGAIPEDVLNASVNRLAKLARETAAAGVGQSGYNIAKPLPFAGEHHLVARRIAEESIVLLKNDRDMLPLRADATLAVIGDFAARPRYQGAGSSNVNPAKVESALEVMERYGLPVAGFEPGFERFGKVNRGLARKAAALAAKADVVLLWLGLDEAIEAEGLDRTHIDLPANQAALVAELAQVNPNLVVVLSCGSVIAMPWAVHARALVHGYLSGQAGAEAMVRVLTGAVNPSGKLAETHPVEYASVPSAPHFPGNEATVEYREGLFVGYRHYAARPREVQFPFGFGLSYTRFTYTDLEASPTEVSFTLANTGTRAGAETAQFYVSKPDSALIRPLRELKGFEKIQLEAGASTRVTIPFDAYTFRVYNTATGRWEVEGGTYRLMVGSSSMDIHLETDLEKAGTRIVPLVDKDQLPSYCQGEAHRAGVGEFELLLGRPLPAPQWDRTAPLDYNATIAQCRYARSGVARLAYHGLVSAHRILWRLGRRKTANLIMMSFYHMPFRGIAKMMGGMVNRAMVQSLLVMVNGRFFGGLRSLIKEFKQNRKVHHG